MRLLIEIVVAVGLIALAWGKPLRERIPGLKPAAESVAVSRAPATPATVAASAKAAAPPRAVVTPVAALPLPTPVPTVSGAWMWEKDRRTSLDASSPARAGGKRP